MQQTQAGRTGTPFLWVGPGRTPDGSDLLERTASAFDLAVDYCSYDDLPKKIAAAPWKLVAVDVGSAPGDGLERLKKLRQQMPRVCIFAAAAHDQLDILPEALRSGASDFLSLPFSPTELNKALIRFSQHVDDVPEVQGELVCVYGARGGLGSTTVALTLAAQLARATRAEAGLLDLDVFRGDVSAALGLDGSRSIGALSGADAIDQAALGRSVVRSSGDLVVLQAPPEFEDAELVSRDCVSRVLELFKARCRFTVIDTARQVNEISITAFQESDRVLLLTDLSIPGVRAAQRSLDLLARHGVESAHIEVLMTELERSGIKLDEVSKALGKREVTMLPRDPAAFGAPGSTTALGGEAGSPFTTVIAGIARRLSGERGSVERPLLKRLFSLGRA